MRSVERPMAWSSSRRSLNTGYHTPEGGIDPLSDSDTAKQWLVSALERYRPRAAARTGPDGRPVIVLNPPDVEQLRRVRLAVTELVAQRQGSRALTANLRVSVYCVVSTVVESLGTGADQVLGIVLSEILVAQQVGTWTC